MKGVIKTSGKLLLAVVLGVVYMWFALSFAWSAEEMSTTERFIGVVYCCSAYLMYDGLKGLLRLN